MPHRTRRGATSKGTPLFVEPQASDPELIARKRAVNPNVRIPPKMQWVTDEDGNILKHELPGETLWHRIRDTYAALFYSSVVTHIPFHFIRLGVNGDAGQSGVLGSPDDPDGNLSTVGD